MASTLVAHFVSRVQDDGAAFEESLGYLDAQHKGEQYVDKRFRRELRERSGFVSMASSSAGLATDVKVPITEFVERLDHLGVVLPGFLDSELWTLGRCLCFDGSYRHSAWGLEGESLVSKEVGGFATAARAMVRMSTRLALGFGSSEIWMGERARWALDHLQVEHSPEELEADPIAGKLRADLERVIRGTI